MRRSAAILPPARAASHKRSQLTAQLEAAGRVYLRADAKEAVVSAAVHYRAVRKDAPGPTTAHAWEALCAAIDHLLTLQGEAHDR